MTRKASDRQLILLTLKNSAQGTIEGRTRLQKLVYLLKKAYGFNFSYKFTPYLYGPYCPDLQTDIDFLVSLGLVEEFHEVTTSGIRHNYQLTKSGRELAQTIESKYGKQRKLAKNAAELSQSTTGFLIFASKTLSATTPDTES